MLAILIALAVSLFVTLLGTPLLIRLLVAHQFGQFVRQDGPTSHFTKRGTPTMGGLIIILATVIGYGVALLVMGRGPSASALLLLFLMVGTGFVGFLDDFAKIRHRQSLGLTPILKIIGQGAVGIIFAVLVLQFRDKNNRPPATMNISFIRDTGLTLAFAGGVVGIILFILWANFLITAWTNAVNLTDGLDGLATGASMIAFGAYTVITIWQSNQACQGVLGATPGCYQVRDPRDLSIICVAIMGACFGFLWWNTSPAQIFMGDTGSLALGGAFAGLSILTHTEVLAVLIGGLFVIEVCSDVLQVGFFKLTGRRVLRMAPLHHHFELKGWNEVTVVVRFWVIEALLMGGGIGLFYTEWLAQQ
ncbi:MULTISPECIES: phospho-N-acetylmuramoyl-pentapeptide-transferase [unclassified Actinobaculum]|uniref:phospho-N-acetylmuramoyl-pentapeptide- transferase n=1 Tax=unclassified Actinobaculum TaxID=2609299 RepID=UPI000D529BE0|nr:MULTISPECIES: phospho-N-acetylmuramoyl-pentapeptide-transferase [unclassified Actinobaculum]AWE42596.1 phospho-N-acetylmuramoyl-pentapeptide-transferase [Actinobaculum sp. 313]RTE48111.1 phospho-N-acetylmuramoyl-pentapeptide-transferase [Actinobaculum sp. 352]